MPARAPASIDMLHRVMRPSIDSERTALPAYSMVQPLPPAVPIRPIAESAASFAVTPRGKDPSIATRMFFIFLASRHWVARTCSTSDVPIPNARQANAPWVLVWESPHTTVMPGSVARSEEHTSELQSRFDLVCRLLLEKKKKKNNSVYFRKKNKKKKKINT